MPAHLRPLTRTCDQPGCSARARYELRDTYNAVLGHFCEADGERRLRQQLADERAAGQS